MTVDSKKLENDGDPSLPAMSLLNTNFLNSVILDAKKGAPFVTAEIKSNYLQSPMKIYQYMRIPLKYFTQEIREKYDIMEITSKGSVYIEIHKGIYGIKEADTLAFKYVFEKLAPHGCNSVK